ncbi:MAG: hypothetical protein QNJ41_24710 [Xenococcaceae cyanobacterium MO_188.B32]|nr:hypothetical protein [Xenococcaceae cyanobacterium MO_188.B32]
MMLNELDEITKEIYRQYKPALKYIGIDFSQEEVQEAIINCYFGLEEAFQAVIVYWKYKKQNQEQFYPNAALIEALNEHWKPFDWHDKYLEDSRFKSPCLLWWEEAGNIWGREIRNQLIADVNETNWGDEYILLQNGEKISLKIAKLKGWDWVKNYAQSQM